MGRFRLDVVVLAFVALAGGVSSSGCGSSKKLKAAGLDCTINSDCAETLVCIWSRCHMQCKESRDCRPNERCVKTGTANICQLPDEAPCALTSECDQPLVCGRDWQCRNQCGDERDCGLGQKCTPESKVCADLPELDPTTGEVIARAAPDGGADAGADGPLDGPELVHPDAASGDAGADGPAAPASICEVSCESGTSCVEGRCEPCGELEQTCCGKTCNGGLSCSAAGRCSCGNAREVCCGGKSCGRGLDCEAGMCSCGKAGGACCPDQTCANANLVCAGTACGCFQACAAGFGGGFTLLRVDGAVHGDNGVSDVGQILRENGAPLKAVSIARGQRGGCAVGVDGTVACWGFNEAGQLGIGDLSLASSPSALRVVTAVGGPPLSGMKKVFGGVETYCAVNAEGNAWCWGRGREGELGNGAKNNSSIAVPVLAAPGGAPLGGIDHIALGNVHACARKLDGSVLCWGSNAFGQLGPGEPTAIPRPVMALGNTVLEVVAASATTCAVTMDQGVTCFGDNRGGGAGDGSLEGSLPPTRVLLAKDGPPLVGVKRLMATYAGLSLSGIYVGVFCADKSDGGFWCWGGNLAPRAATAATEAVTDVFQIGPGCILRKNGRYWGARGSDFQMPPAQPSCP